MPEQSQSVNLAEELSVLRGRHARLSAAAAEIAQKLGKLQRCTVWLHGVRTLAMLAEHAVFADELSPYWGANVEETAEHIGEDLTENPHWAKQKRKDVPGYVLRPFFAASHDPRLSALHLGFLHGARPGELASILSAQPLQYGTETPSGLALDELHALVRYHERANSKLISEFRALARALKACARNIDTALSQTDLPLEIDERTLPLVTELTEQVRAVLATVEA